MRTERWSRKLRQFWELSHADKWLFFLAVFWLGVARIWLAVVPFKRLAGRLSGSDGSAEADPELIRRVGYAVSKAGANVPWRSDCFPQSIAALKLLKRCGHSSKIHLGVERTGKDEILGHAWLTCGDIVVTGGEQLDRFAEIHRLGE